MKTVIVTLVWLFGLVVALGVVNLIGQVVVEAIRARFERRKHDWYYD